MAKYDINLIKEMRLKGKTLQEISEYYNVKKSTISKFLKRNNIVFWKLPRKCNYCGKIFIPQKPNHKYCSKKHYKFHRQEKNAQYFKRKVRRNVSLNRDYPSIAYKDAINSLNDLQFYAQTKGCSWCGEHDFGIADGEVYCKKCGLVFDD